jgi:hypothetical protein
MGWGTYGLVPARNLDFADHVPGQILRLVNEIKPHRLFIGSNIRYPIWIQGGSRQTFYPLNMSTALSYRTIQGYDPIRIKSFNDLESLPYSHLFYLSATRILLNTGDMGDMPGFKRKRLDDLSVYEIQPPAQYITVPTDVRVMPDADMRLAALKDPAFPVYRTVLLNEPLPTDVMSHITTKNIQVEYRLVVDDPDRQVFDTHTSRPALLVFSEVYFPGWKAVIDGEPTRIHVANHAFRSIFLPAGEHHIEFKYEPAWYPLLFVVIGLWFLAAGSIVYLKRKVTHAPVTRGFRLQGADGRHR